MKEIKIGLLFKEEVISKYDLRFMVEMSINCDDNKFEIDKGYHIDEIYQLKDLDDLILTQVDDVIDMWGYSIDWTIQSYKEKMDDFNDILEVDKMEESDYFVLVTLFKDNDLNIDNREFNFSLSEDDAQISFLAMETEINKDHNYNFIAIELIDKYNLYHNPEMRRWFVNYIGLSNLTYGDLCSIVTNMINNYAIEKRYEHDKFSVILGANRELVKWLMNFC